MKNLTIKIISLVAFCATFTACSSMKDASNKYTNSTAVNAAVKIVFDKLKDQDVDARAIGLFISGGKLGKARFIPFWRKLTPEQAAFIEAFLTEADMRNRGISYEGGELKYGK